MTFMTGISPPLAFATWRGTWSSLQGIPELLVAADAALRRRMAGNNRVPQWEPGESERETLGRVVCALWEWANDKPPSDVAARPRLIRYFHEAVSPALRAVAWPRWLLLERAFLDASATSDLLFAAVVLRTMCEEAIRLHALDIDGDALASLAESAALSDHVRLKQFLSSAWACLATLPRDTVLDRSGWPSFKSTAKSMPRLEAARFALNSYVHPNYGSHIAALFPECASAARVLLEAVIEVYRAFFALSWSEAPVTGNTHSPGVSALESWNRTAELLLSHTLPEIRRSAENDALAGVMKAPAITEWLTTERDDLSVVLREPAATPLFEDLPRRPTDPGGSGELEFMSWDGARPVDILDFAVARRADKQLASEFPIGAPDPTDQVRWLRFNALSLQLAMLIDKAKAGSFKAQLVRQVVQGNSLAAFLCVRSLVEHRALAVFLSSKVEESLNAVAAESRANEALPQAAGQTEAVLSDFLAGKANQTREEVRAWVMSEEGGVRVTRLDLEAIVEAVFPQQDRFRNLYALSSAAMHGRSCRGIDLALRASDVTTSARRIAFLVLERICDQHEEMDHLSAAGRALNRMKHAGAFGGTSAAVTDRIAQQVFGHFGEAFISGADYSGDGTKESPFLFASHLEYHRASYALLKLLGVDVGSSKRALDRDASGHICDRWYGPGREYWFRTRI